MYTSLTELEKNLYTNVFPFFKSDTKILHTFPYYLRFFSAVDKTNLTFFRTGIGFISNKVVRILDLLLLHSILKM